MKGNIEYEIKYQNKIDGLLAEEPRLCGFYSFIGDKSISTIYNYLLHVNGFLKFTNKDTNKLNIDDFSGYMMRIQKNQKGEKSTSSYRIAVYSALKKYGKYLKISNQLTDNPMNYIDRPKPIETQKTIEKREIGYLTKEEIPQYILTVEDGVGTTKMKSQQKTWKERDIAIILLFLNTGIRSSALMKIDVDDIDFVNNILIVTDKESLVSKYELSDELIEVINSWMVKREEILQGKNVDALFISNRKQRIGFRSVYTIVNKYDKNILGKHITPHKLRATYGTQLYEETGDVYFVQKCMHHKNPKTTELYIRGHNNQTKIASEIMKELTII